MDFQTQRQRFQFNLNVIPFNVATVIVHATVTLSSVKGQCNPFFFSTTEEIFLCENTEKET